MDETDLFSAGMPSRSDSGTRLDSFVLDGGSYSNNSNQPGKRKKKTIVALEAARKEWNDNNYNNDNEDTTDDDDEEEEADVEKFVEESYPATCVGGRRTDTHTKMEKPKNYIVQLIFELEHALLALHATDLTIPKLEKMATFIYESMSMATRNYHSVRHVFDIINFDERLCESNPIAILAACFHDCVYYHVDGGLTPFQAHILHGTYKLESCDNTVVAATTTAAATDYDNMNTSQIYKFFVTNDSKYQDDLLMVETIFGYTAGQQINVTGDGLNEYLSAVVAVRMLADHLPNEMLVEIACCIEATIPFRPRNKDTGQTHMMTLYDNMETVTRIYNLTLTEHDIVKSVQRACLLSNSDVGNFGTKDRYWFLDNTWSLLPETNESLRNEYVYSVEHFYTALYKMYGFFGFLQPDVVFHDFRGVPTTEELSNLVAECGNNLELGRKYVGAKLVAMGLVSALAVLSGGDAPINLFTGDLRAEKRHKRQSASRRSLSSTAFQLCTIRCTDETHDTEEELSGMMMSIPEDEVELTELVYDILANGRRSNQNFDTKRSPWAALLYQSLGDAGLEKILSEKDNLPSPMTEDHAWILLRSLPFLPVHTIANTIAEQALSRTDRILDILRQLQHEDEK